jgi:diketogulonate reductase-like aldo/keto reductase
VFVTTKLPSGAAGRERRTLEGSLAVGVSNYRTAQLDELIGATGEAPQVNQIPWAPSLYDAALLGEHRRRGVLLEGYSPFTDLRHPVLVEIAARHGVTLLRWGLGTTWTWAGRSRHRWNGARSCSASTWPPSVRRPRTSSPTSAPTASGSGA